MKTALITVGMTASIVFAQPKSAVQFYDTLGTNKTAKIGWTGDNTNGEFFVETPDGTLRLKNGDLTVPGSVTANSFSGETDPTITANEIKDGVSANEVAGLSDSLGRKADTSSVNSLQATVNSLSSSAGDITKITAGTGLEGGGESGDVTISADIGTGTGQVAAGDHDHDSDYLSSSTQLSSITGAIGGDKITDGSIDSADIGSDQVGRFHLRDNSVTSVHIENNTITNADIHSSAYISGSKINPDFGNQTVRTTGSVRFSDPTYPSEYFVFDKYHEAEGQHRFILRKSPNRLFPTDMSQGEILGVSSYSSDTDDNHWQFNAKTVDVFHHSAVQLRVGVPDWSPSGHRVVSLHHDGSNGTVSSAVGNLNLNSASSIVANKSLSVSGSVSASGTCCSSDRKFKSCILPIENALERILKLRGVSYKWKTEEFPERNFSTGLQIGLIAQEVENVLPELVQTDQDGYKSLEYGKLTAVLVEAVKEQQCKISALEEENKKMRNELDKIKEHLGLVN